ncbi:MAG TPA: hypothetical protein PLZ93_14760, partial [Nocardioides sp.]|nr:hypothetical protein [Nocardioides sp.]
GETYTGSLFDIAAPEAVAPASQTPPPPVEPVETPAAAPPAEPEPEAEEKPKPATSGEAHTPKTDVDINESSSLFDL